MADTGSAPVVPHAPHASLAATAPTAVVYPSHGEALRAVREDYLYWTGKLTDTSLQLSLAVIATNWATFGSIDQILANWWSKFSVALVIISLGVSVAGAKWMGELHCARIDYAEADPQRWEREFRETAGLRNPWPFTDGIEVLGRILREAKTWLPLAGGVAYLVALLWR